MKKLNNEDYDKYLKENNRKIIRLGMADGGNKDILHRCLVCGHEWETKPHTIKCGRGCPNCVGVVPVTNKSYDKYLKDNDRKIVRLGNANGADFPVLHRCEICAYEWTTTPHIIKGGCGCLRCADVIPVTNESYDKLN